MGTLYVVGLPAGNPDDLTHRARRVLESVALRVATDPALAQSRLAACGLAATATIPVPRDAMTALAGGDVALVVDGIQAAVGDQACALVAASLENAFPVVPVPGPTLALTALVVSGLPADSFAYLGDLPEQAGARDALIDAVRAEPRTLLFIVRSADVDSALHALCRTLGDRPLVVASDTRAGQIPPWRGTLEAAREDPEALPGDKVLVFVVGGATGEPEAWDVGRLTTAIERRVARGEGAKEISQALAGVSGWSRREIYRRATGRTGTRVDW